MQTAKDWGMTPSQFRALSEDDRALMWAHTMTTAGMRSWEQHEQERKIKEAEARTRRR